MKRLNLCLVIAWLFAGYSAIAAVADRFDYPIGNRDRYTEANDGDGWYSAQEFGDWSASSSNYHLGEDWNAETGGNTDCGSPVYAVANGTIVYASIVTGWGRVLIVRHTLPDGSEVESLYGHLGSFTKTSGNVARGEQVGTIGDGSEGGSVYFCHLHFEIRTAGCPKWGVPGAGGSATPKPAGWTDPSDFIDSHRQAQTLSTVLINDARQWNYFSFGGFDIPDLYATNPLVGLFEPTTDGIRVKAHRYRGAGMLITKSAYYLSGSTIEYTWSGTGGASFMNSLFGPMTGVWPSDTGSVGTMWLWSSYGNSWDGTWVPTANRVYTTVVTITTNSFASATTDSQTGAVTENRSGSFDFTVPLRLWLRQGDTFDYQNAFIYLMDLRITTPFQVIQIVTQPTNQTVLAGSNGAIGVAATSVSPLNYQWGQGRRVIAGATNATLRLNNVQASDSGGYSVVVWNVYGSVVSATAHLAVLADGANGNSPGQPAYPTPSPTDAGKDSLVFITHGRTPPGDSSNHTWVDDMKNAIKARVAPNWMVIGYKWTEQARAGVTEVVGRARDVGIDAGKAIVALGELTPNHRWERIHFIGHSAGARLVEEASRVVTAASSPAPPIHSTFLDPYTGVWDFGRSEYGKSSTWADCYFSIDTETYDPLVGRTEGPIDHAYNVDVGWLDANKTVVGYSDSEYVAGGVPCGAVSSHGWPHDYYLRTILNNLPTCAGPYGYGLTMEAGGWGSRIDYPTGMSATPPCQSCPPPPMPTYQQPFRFEPAVNLDLTSYGISLQGVVVSGKGATLTFPSGQPAPTGGRDAKDGGPEPVWLAVAMPVTNGVNFVQFDAAFTSTNAAEGLLTVYWNTNEIGRVDERFASPGLQTYRLALPSTVTEGVYTLSFRLDSFSASAASVTVTNIATGFAGITEPITLAMAAPGSNMPPVLRLTAPTGQTYLVQSSTNLTSWTPAVLLVNTNGTVHFTDPGATNGSQRFYRAMLP